MIARGRWWLVYILAALISTAVGLAASQWPYIRQFELRAYDYRFGFRGSPPAGNIPPITIVVIDERSLSRIPDPLMVWHRHFGRVIQGLFEGGAAAIGLDFIFSDIERLDAESSRELNAAVAQAGASGTPVILAYRVLDDGVEQPPLSLRMAAAVSGQLFAFANLTTDPDDFVRRQQLKGAGLEGEAVQGWALAVAQAYARKSGQPMPEPPSDNILINYLPRGSFPTVSFAEVLEARQRNDKEFLESRFRNRIVLVGSAGGRGSPDLHSTPHYYWSSSAKDGFRTAGVEIHANTIATLLAGNAIREGTFSTQAQFILLVAGLMVIAWRWLAPSRAAALTLAIAAAGGATLVWLFGRGVWIWAVSPAIAGGFAIGLTQSMNYLFEGRERRRLHRLFGRYVSDQVITELLVQPESVVLTGERRRIAVMFSDIRGFTTRSESSTPEAIVDFLNTYFSEVIEVIQKHGGTVNSLMGDGLMAMFGAPVADPDAAFHAVEAAREMMKAVERLNVRLKSDRFEPFRIGIGINAGEAVVGNMGSPRMMEYTAIGDVVNTASRIEGKTKDVQADILISESAYEWLNGRVLCEPRGEVAVKGRAATVRVYAVPWA